MLIAFTRLIPRRWFAFSMLPDAVPLELPIVTREHFNRWYSLQAYYTALTLADAPIQAACIFIYTIITYLMTAQPLEFFRFGLFFGIILMTAFVAQSVGLVVGALFNVKVIINAGGARGERRERGHGHHPTYKLNQNLFDSHARVFSAREMGHLLFLIFSVRVGAQTHTLHNSVRRCFAQCLCASLGIRTRRAHILSVSIPCGRARAELSTLRGVFSYQSSVPRMRTRTHPDNAIPACLLCMCVCLCVFYTLRQFVNKPDGAIIRNSQWLLCVCVCCCLLARLLCVRS